jgi:hypothetical protein
MPPQVAMEYDWGRIFAWAATLGGLKNIRNFKIQVMPDMMLAQQAAAGNVVPMPMRGRMAGQGASPGNAMTNNTGMNQLGERPDVGLSPTI